jgi:hypothetical protein
MIRPTLLATGCFAALAFAALPTSASDESTVAPLSPHQEKVLRGAQQTDTPSGAVGDVQCGMPATPHQKQVLSESRPAESQKMQPESGMPATPHQQQALKGQQPESDSVAVPTMNGMPASPHQQQVLKTDKVRQPSESC